MGNLDIDTDIHEQKTKERRDHGNASISQGTPKITSKPSEAMRGIEQICPQ